MLTKLRITHFKAWQDTGDIRLAPLTVLFGSNSAGKTSIPQLLLLLKQTAESPDRQRALHLGDSRTLVDAGTFEDAAHGHDVSQPVRFSLTWSLDGDLEVQDPLTNHHYAGDELKFTAEVGTDEKLQPRTKSFQYELRKRQQAILNLKLEEKRAAKKHRKKAEFELSSPNYPLTRHAGRPWALPEPLRFYGFPAEMAAYYQNAAFASDFVLEIERMLKSIFYVGPLREYPKRLYLWSGEVPDHVGVKGERAIEAIFLKWLLTHE